MGKMVKKRLSGTTFLQLRYTMFGSSLCVGAQGSQRWQMTYELSVSLPLVHTPYSQHVQC